MGRNVEYAKDTCKHTQTQSIAKLLQFKKTAAWMTLASHRLMDRVLQAHHLIRLRSFIPLHDVKLDGVAFLQTLVPVRLNCCVMHEHIGAVVAPNESEPFCIIEPLHFAFVLRHGTRTSSLQIGNRKGSCRYRRRKRQIVMQRMKKI